MSRLVIAVRLKFDKVHPACRCMGDRSFGHWTSSEKVERHLTSCRVCPIWRCEPPDGLSEETAFISLCAFAWLQVVNCDKVFLSSQWKIILQWGRWPCCTDMISWRNKHLAPSIVSHWQKHKDGDLQRCISTCDWCLVSLSQPQSSFVQNERKSGLQIKSKDFPVWKACYSPLMETLSTCMGTETCTYETRWQRLWMRLAFCLRSLSIPEIYEEKGWQNADGLPITCLRTKWQAVIKFCFRVSILMQEFRFFSQGTEKLPGVRLCLFSIISLLWLAIFQTSLHNCGHMCGMWDGWVFSDFSLQQWFQEKRKCFRQMCKWLQFVVVSGHLLEASSLPLEQLRLWEEKCCMVAGPVSVAFAMFTCKPCLFPWPRPPHGALEKLKCENFVCGVTLRLSVLFSCWLWQILDQATQNKSWLCSGSALALLRLCSGSALVRRLTWNLCHVASDTKQFL